MCGGIICSFNINISNTMENRNDTTQRHDQIVQIMPNMPNIAKLDKDTYAQMMGWKEFMDSGRTLDHVPYDPSWTVLFALLRKRNGYNQIYRTLSEEVKSHDRIYPKPEFLFSAFVLCPATALKVVIIGQDPYFNTEKDSANVDVPQAYGLSFSVPNNFSIPSSLQNIYANMLEFKHIDKMPKSGNLWFWAIQGCLMLNAALTVKNGIKNSHAQMWKWMTDEIIKYISTYFQNIVFVLWGADASKKIDLINQDSHHIIMSSHPSGLSFSKPMGKHPAFRDFDHFGEINRILKEHNKTPIMWKVT